MKYFLMLCLIFCCFFTVSQERARRAERPGVFHKFLTTGETDEWSIPGKKDDIIMAYVNTSNFDSVLKVIDPKGKVLRIVDEEGSNSSLAMRLTTDGEHKICVEAFKNRGSGTYRLHLSKFQGRFAELEKNFQGRLTRKGEIHHYFQAKKGQILIPSVKNFSWEIFNEKGRRVSNHAWSQVVQIKKSGEYYLKIEGRSLAKYDLCLRSARMLEIQKGKEIEKKLHSSEMHIWNYKIQNPEFVVVEILKRGSIRTQFISHNEAKYQESIQFLPISSKGARVRYAVVLKKKGNYQLQILAISNTSYRLHFLDPTVSMPLTGKISSKIKIGGTAFYRFKAFAGQLLQMDLSSQHFDPQLKLYDDQGKYIDKNDDGEENLNSKMMIMVKKTGYYRLLTSSVGNGGGGDYQLRIRKKDLLKTRIGQRVCWKLENNAYWSFEGKKDQAIIVNVHSKTLDPKTVLFDPSGTALISDDDSGIGSDSLFAVKLPKTGRYTIFITAQKGKGDYTLRLINGD